MSFPFLLFLCFIYPQENNIFFAGLLPNQRKAMQKQLFLFHSDLTFFFPLCPSWDEKQLMRFKANGKEID